MDEQSFCDDLGSEVIVRGTQYTISSSPATFGPGSAILLSDLCCLVSDGEYLKFMALLELEGVNGDDGGVRDFVLSAIIQSEFSP